MSFATKPTFVKQAFANNGIKNTIPDTTLNEGYASYDEGFPAITMQPKESGGLPPRGQDMNGILNELSQFNQYQQMGGTYGLDNNILTNGGYAKNSIVYQDDGIYRSLVDNNTDDFVDDPSVIGSTWQLIVDYNEQNGTNGVPGQLSHFARTDVPSGWLRCDGTQYIRTSFPDFWDNYLTNNKLPTCSYAEYATEISDYGNCGKFAVDLVNLTFKVPTIQGEVFISQALISGDIGKFNQQTLTNTSGNNGIGIPTNIQYPIFVCVANVQVPVSEAQYNGFINNLTLKADKNGSNVNESFFTGATFTADTVDYIVESGSNTYGSYRKYRSNKTIQTGSFTIPAIGALGSSLLTITLPTTTSSKNYRVFLTKTTASTYYSYIESAVITKTKTNFTVKAYNNVASGTSAVLPTDYVLIED